MLSKAEAMRRLERVRANFPKGTITKGQAIDMLMAVVDSQVGYASSSSVWSIYGEPDTWQTRWNGRQVYWCALGASWSFEAAFGAAAAKAGIGLQSTNSNWPPAGWTATWLWRDWLRGQGRWVGIENCQPGDISMQYWGRTANPVDHVEVCTGRAISTNAYPTIGFNTATGNASAGAGVQRATRYRAQTVGIYRPDWDAIVLVYNAQKIAEGVLDLTDEVIDALTLLDYEGSVDGVVQFQRDHGLVPDGIVGPKTSDRLESEVSKVEERLLAAIDGVKEDVNKLRSERLNHDTDTRNQLNRMEATGEEHRRQLNVVGRVAAEARDNWWSKERRDEIIKQVLGYSEYGFSLSWWLRRGFLGRKYDHPHYPFDPGSPADLEHRTAEAVTDETIPPYGSEDDGEGSQPVIPPTDPHREV